MNTQMINSKEEIPDEAYRKMVLTLMDRQAGREIATAEVFGQCVIFAPTLDDKLRITRYQNEELKHFKLVARLMAELGVDMDRYVADRKRAGARFTGNEDDVRVSDWIDATLFNFMIDRAATYQLTEYTRGSYVPLAKANLSILRDEERHKDFGEQCLVQMCRDAATRAEVQRRFHKWFVGAMRIFGRPGTPGNRYCLEVGLKQRDSGEIAAAYLDSIRPVMARCGLKFPRREDLPIEVAPQLNLEVPAAAPVETRAGHVA
ncbi:MAG TPA: ferritin-like fold-containing protein [Candidatus Binataceae bacterium]|nr:ferritin-like fold-containing protein [Candidatus Binataceae bacterium]